MARVIVLNGTSSAGKTTLARALRPRLDAGFCFFSSDQLADAGFRPLEPVARLEGRGRFFDGFHRAVAAFADAGNDLLVEHIVEEQAWADDLLRLLGGHDVFWVGVHAPLAVAEARERVRGDRTVGEARFHMKTHGFVRYDVEVETTSPTDAVLEQIVAAWRGRRVR